MLNIKRQPNQLMSNLFPNCVFYPKRGISWGIQCRKECKDDSGFCMTHSHNAKQRNNSKRNAILHEACFGNNDELVLKCLEILSLTQEQIDIEFKEVLTLGFREQTAYALLLSPKYFIDSHILAANLDNSAFKKIVSFFLYKRFLIREYLKTISGLTDLIPHILDPRLKG